MEGQTTQTVVQAQPTIIRLLKVERRIRELEENQQVIKELIQSLTDKTREIGSRLEFLLTAQAMKEQAEEEEQTPDYNNVDEDGDEAIPTIDQPPDDMEEQEKVIDPEVIDQPVTPRLTETQAKVLDGLKAGKNMATIGREMGQSRVSIFKHKVHLRKLGLIRDEE